MDFAERGEHEHGGADAPLPKGRNHRGAIDSRKAAIDHHDVEVLLRSRFERGFSVHAERDGPLLAELVGDELTEPGVVLDEEESGHHARSFRSCSEPLSGAVGKWSAKTVPLLFVRSMTASAAGSDGDVAHQSQADAVPGAGARRHRVGGGAVGEAVEDASWFDADNTGTVVRNADRHPGRGGRRGDADVPTLWV